MYAHNSIEKYTIYTFYKLSFLRKQTNRVKNIIV